MTVAASSRRAGPYAGNGIATSFAFDFKVFQKSDVSVVLTDENGTESPLVLDSDYSVVLNADQDANPGGTITYPALIGPAPLPANQTLTMIGGMTYDQATDITNAGRFLPQVIENTFDKVTILIQQLREVSSRTLQAAVGTTVKLVFPAPSSGKFLRWRSDLTGLENVDGGTDSMALQGLIADSAINTRGAGMVGYGGALSYPAGTVGAALRVTGIVVDNITSLKALLKTGNPRAFVAGYAAKGDGGGGAYYYDSSDTTSTDNGGTVIVATDGGRWKLIVGDTVSVKQFGAKGDNSTNDTAALQAAVNYGIASSKAITAPPGTYRYTAITVNGGLTLLGAGQEFTTLRCTVLTGTGISVDTQTAFRCSGFSFDASGSVTAGTCINLNSSTPGTANQHTRITDCTFTSHWNCITTVSAYLWKIERCTFNLYKNVAVHVQNDFNGDAGDSMIGPGNIFAGQATTSSTGIQHISSGGLRVTNNKFVQGGTHYKMVLAHTIQTGVLVFTGNSVENPLVSGIQMNRVAGGAADMHFTGVTISGNEFLGTTAGIPINLNDTDNSWLQEVSIVGNAIDIRHAGTPAYAILVNGADCFCISGNSIAGNSGGTAGIGVGANATNGIIGPNAMSGIPNPISNGSPSTAVSKKVYQTITGGITCSTAYGSLFAGNTTVTWPTGLFTNSPNVQVTPVAGTGAISAIVSAVNGTSCTVSAIANTNGAAVSVHVRAEADY